MCVTRKPVVNLYCIIDKTASFLHATCGIYNF